MIPLLSVFLFGLIVVSWTHVFRILIDHTFHSRILKWTFWGIGLILFLGINFASVYAKMDAEATEVWTYLLKTSRISDYSVFLPPGLFTEMLYSFNEEDFLISAACFLGMLTYLWTGLKVGSLLIANTMEKTGTTLSGVQPGSRRRLFMERAEKWVERIVPDRYVPVLLQELTYLLRWNRVWVIVTFCVFVSATSFFALQVIAPTLLGVCPLFFCMARFMNCFLNKDGTAVVHYFLLPIRNVDLVISKNIALLLFQYLITIPFAVVGFTVIWKMVSLAEVGCLIFTMISMPLICMTFGNVVAFTNPFKITRVFSAISTRETTSNVMINCLFGLMLLIVGIILMYSIPKFILESEITAVILLGMFTILSFGLYKWSISRSALLMEKEAENILFGLKIC